MHEKVGSELVEPYYQFCMLVTNSEGRVLIEKFNCFIYSQGTFPHFMESERSSSHSQEPTTSK